MLHVFSKDATLMADGFILFIEQQKTIAINHSIVSSSPSIKIKDMSR
jgi:hypothetical protein